MFTVTFSKMGDERASIVEYLALSVYLSHTLPYLYMVTEILRVGEPSLVVGGWRGVGVKAQN